MISSNDPSDAVDRGVVDRGIAASARPARPAPSRRAVLRGAASAGAAGLAASAFAGAAVPAVAADRSATRNLRAGTSTANGAGTGDQIVVHVLDVRSGLMDVLRGTSQTSLRDPELAARLARASQTPASHAGTGRNVTR
jgi:hypothetical protein